MLGIRSSLKKDWQHSSVEHVYGATSDSQASFQRFYLTAPCTYLKDPMKGSTPHA